MSEEGDTIDSHSPLGHPEKSSSSMAHAVETEERERSQLSKVRRKTRLR